LEDAAGIGVLQAKPDLDPEEPKTHVPDLEELQSSLGHLLPPPIARRFMPAMRKYFHDVSWSAFAHATLAGAISVSKFCVTFQE
jgi:hypothetical protein